MSRDNAKKYPRTIESKNSYLRIRAPEHLDVALEGLIRKVLKEQPKMDDIYAFAADYFDMLLKLREKSGIRKLSIQDVCPHHNEEDANEMIKLASTFTKKKKDPKPKSRSYRAVSIHPGDHRHEKKGTKMKEGDLKTPKNGERFNTILPIVNEHPELEDAKPVETVANAVKDEKPESEAEESELEFVGRLIPQDSSEKIVEAREVILEEDGEEDGNDEESTIGAVGDINEIRDKIKVVENEIKSLEKRESDVGEEGKSTVAPDEEVKSEVEDVGTAEATAIVEEPLQESEDTKQNAEDEVTIQEVTGDDERKKTEEEKGNAEEMQSATTETTSEAIEDTQETGAEAEKLADDTKEQEKSDATDETEEKKNDQTDVEEIQETKSVKTDVQTGEPDTLEEKAEEEPPNDEIAEQEPQEPKSDTTVEQMDEPDTVQETMGEGTGEEVAAQETLQAAQDDNATAPEVDTTSEEPEQTEPNAADKVEDSEIKPEAEGAVGGTLDTDAQEDGTAEETKETLENAENEDTEEVNVNANDVGAKMRLVDPAQAEEPQLMGGIELKDEKRETEGFINAEKQFEEVQNAELSSEPVEIGPVNEPAVYNTEKIADDNTVVITVPENVEEKATEEESVTNDSKEAGDAESVVQETIAVVGGLGAAAAMLQHAKKELTDPKVEETIKNEKKTEEENPEPSAEMVLMGEEPGKTEMTLTEEVQKFLDTERQHSSYDKESEEECDADDQSGNQNAKTLDVEGVNEIVPGALARMTLAEKEDKGEEAGEKGQSGPSDIEAEGDDQDHEGSTTSGEFEISLSKYAGQEANTAETDNQVESAGNVPEDAGHDAGEKTAEAETNAVPEPRIVLELNTSGSEDHTTTDNIPEAEAEPVKVFLSVPETVTEEYPGRNPENAMTEEESPSEDHSRSKRSVDASGEDAVVNAEEVILECGNVGNELIQTGEVQKVELIEGDEDILQVHLTTTIETVQESGDSLLVQMTSKIDPSFEVTMETKIESPDLNEKMRLVRAAVVIQNGFRRFRMRKITGEPLDASTDDQDPSILSETKLSTQTLPKDASSGESESSFSSSSTKIVNRDFKGRNLSRSVTRTLLETHSSDPIRKITPLKTRSLSSIRYGVADFEVWNQLVKELEEAATKIQSNYRGYKTRKKLQRGNAIQSTTTTSEESSTFADAAEVNHRHTGEFHDSVVILPPK